MLQQVLCTVTTVLKLLNRNPLVQDAYLCDSLSVNTQPRITDSGDNSKMIIIRDYYANDDYDSYL